MDTDNTKEILERLDRIEKILNEHLVPSCDKMSNHINFIEDVYQYVKKPMHYIINRFNNSRLIQ